MTPDSAQDTAADTRSRSRVVVDGADRAAARSYLYAIGLTDEDLRKPIVGVANTWTEIGPCNYHLRRLSCKVGWSF
jgi:dihydroxy-acid dehydratase